MSIKSAVGPIVVKIGGSLIFGDSKALKASRLKRVFDAFSEELGENVVYVLGSGSIMHDLSFKYKMNDPADIGIRMRGFAMMTSIIRERLSVIEKTLAYGVIDPMHMFYKATRGNKFSSEIVWFSRMALKKLPAVVTSGVVLDRNILFATISSDSEAAYMATHMHSSRIIMATATDGIIDDQGKTVKTVSIKEYSAIPFITGGMRDKIRRATPAVKAGIEVIVLGGDSVAKIGLSNTLKKGRYTKVVK